MGQSGDRHDGLLTQELQITEPPLWASGGGTWVMGRIAGYRFEALVGTKHAEDPALELRGSRLLKLWLQRIRDRTTVFSWGESRDLVAADGEAQEIVEKLVTGLADRAFGR
jgi:hypothetical protein